MDIAQAKQQVKDAIEAYMATDARGEPLLASEHQRPIFLVGAPGIGKTAIMAQVAGELGLGLVSYSMTHHTRQSALGLPFIVHHEFEGFEYEASEYTMSEIVAAVYDCMRSSGVRRGILFLDEINCVSETLYPSMLQFLQFKTFGRHKVPDGWVVVCAGNPPEYNRSVHEFDVVTLDRVKKIVVEPDYSAWRAYAVESGVHPAVLTFLDIKKDRFYAMESSLDGKSFVTARGWDDLSDIIGVFESLGKPVDKSLVEQYVQNDKIASEFAVYYDLFSKYRDDYRIEDILSGRASEDVRARAKAAEFDERLSLIGLMLESLVGQQRAVVERTDLLVALRDDLRSIKEDALAGRARVPELLEGLCQEKIRQCEMLAASGGSSKKRREALDGQRAMLERLKVEFEEVSKGDVRCDVTDAEGDVVSGDFGSAVDAGAGAGAAAVGAGGQNAGAADADADLALSAAGARDFGVLQALFARESAMDEAVACAEERLAHAFAFIEEVFGNAQEMLVFTTELTQRTASARYIAQYGSASYYAHNENMILSDRQRRLRQRIEELEKL